MATHYRGSAQEGAALDTYIKLMRAADSVTARLDPLMRAADLTVGQFGTLEALLHLGPLCQRDLGRMLLRTGGNITVVVGNLARRGLVRRARGPRDRRFVTVTLTEKGRRLIGGIFPRHVRHVVREMPERRPKMASHRTRFGSLAHYEKGGVEVIKDDARNYVFSNVFEVASKARPYEKVAVGKNIEYVIEAIRAEGTSGWRVACQDEFALVMDGEVEVRLLKPDDTSPAAAGGRGSIPLAAAPAGRAMGRVRARRGHMTLLPAGAAYQFHAASPSVILLQTLAGRDTVERWAEICQTTPRPEEATR